jgi:hypothetical protein
MRIIQVFTDIRAVPHKPRPIHKEAAQSMIADRARFIYVIGASV